ncbi:MAG: cytochrome c [Wenzhouxiangellaceae bacterium]
MRYCLIVALAWLAIPNVVFAQGDADRGAVLAYTCTGCHGIPFYNNIYPTYSVPRLGGQNEQYLISALKAYRSGQRKHATMQAQANTLSDQDIEDVAAYFVRFNGDE